LKKIIFLLYLISFTSVAQTLYPSDYFRNPLDIPLRLAGTFGELRNNHFHAGIDIKTNRRVGLPVYATADGYISRIKVAIWGYGKVIYINHPNGFTTVYAHLHKFGDGIQEYVKNIQYEKKSYETGNIFLKKDQIKVTKGQIIGYSGRTGGFVAPHLHYEIRNTKTEKIINPLVFGIKIQDSIAPKIKKLIAYPIASNSRINRSLKRQSLSIKKDSSNNYITNRISASGKIGLGINVYDLLGKELNKNGIYSLEMKINGKRQYYHNVETFSFSESKFINLLIDYEYYSKYKNRIQKTFREKENKLSIYRGLIEDGIISIEEGLNYQIEIIAKDFEGNSSSLKIPVVGVKSESIINQVKDSTDFKIVKDKFQKFTKNGVTIAFPKKTFYEDVFLNFSVDDRIANIHKPTIPLDKKFTITFDSTMYKNSEVSNIYIANMNNKKYPYYMDTRKKLDKLFTTTKTLGKYGLLIDNQKPKIYNSNFKNNDWVSRLRYLTIKISDSESGIKSYEAYIDDEWILMEYDVKKKKLTYDFKDKKLVGSKHIFKLVVYDNVGNTNTYNSTFYKK